MIAREHRFHGHNSLSYVYRNGQNIRRPLCSLKFTQNPRRETYRAAVVVSKKVSKSAVVRNRIRRRVYAAVQGIVPPEAKYDLVFTAYSAELAILPEKEFNKIIYGILQTSGVGKGKTVGESPAAKS